MFTPIATFRLAVYFVCGGGFILLTPPTIAYAQTEINTTTQCVFNKERPNQSNRTGGSPYKKSVDPTWTQQWTGWISNN